MPFIKSYRVKGRGHFPTDMLRYDSSIARNSDDKASIDAQPGDYGPSWQQDREIELFTICTSRVMTPTPRRWESFGWKVIREGKWEFISKESAMRDYRFDSKTGQFQPDDVQFLR